jgi:glucose/arabinose dehydrogenase
MSTRWFLFSLILLFVLPISLLSQNEISIERAFPNLTFTRPLLLTHPGDGSDRIFVIEQPGTIKVFPNDQNVSAQQVQTFLDIRGRVDDAQGEEGLLGLAFHPDYETNGYFYVNYTAANPSRSVISRFKVNPTDANHALADSEFVLLEVGQPFDNHNGGMLQFGPQDGYLYASFGDGGSGGDPRGHGQNLSTLLGAILRIDVDTKDDGLNYGIPDDNPFVGDAESIRKEIWAYGLRNVWRFSIDEVTGQLWAGDVGQGDWEEVNFIEPGLNYGWNIAEGSGCYNTASCDLIGLIPPVVEYGHTNSRCSVTGGYIYRGALRPELEGAYIYGDYCSSDLWALRYDSGQLVSNDLLMRTGFLISAFGLDAQSELYILELGGKAYRFTQGDVTGVSGSESPGSFSLGQNFPNPFNPDTQITYSLQSAGEVNISIYNALGKKIRTLVSGFRSVGAHEVSWDGLNDAGGRVASGNYYYELKINGQSQIRSMILLR